MRPPLLRLLCLLPLLCATLTPCQALPAMEIAVPEPNTLAAQAQAVLQRAYARLDLVFHPQVVPLRRGLQMAEAGQVDGDLMRNAEVLKEQTQLLRVNVPVAIGVYSAYRRPPCPARVELRELADSRVAYFRGIRSVEMLLPPQALLAARDSWDALRHVQQGITDYAIGMQAESDALLQRRQVTEVCRVTEPVLTIPLYHALHKRHAALLPRLEAVLQEMSRSGEMARIWAAEQKRLDESSPPPTP